MSLNFLLLSLFFFPLPFFSPPAVLVWEIFTLRDPAPYLPADPSGRAAAAAAQSGMRLPVPPPALGFPAALVGACWATDPAVRPTFAEVRAMLDGDAPVRSVNEIAV